MNIISVIFTKILTIFIRAYQKILSPFLGSNCCYYPSCSQYAIESINRHGVINGLWLAVKRISRCHPLSEGGHDPVPEIVTSDNTKSHNSSHNKNQCKHIHSTHPKSVQ